MSRDAILKRRFYDDLRDRAVSWLASRVGGKISRLAEFAFLVPDVAVLIGRMLLDERVPRRLRIKLGMIFLYLASPLDLVPEAFLGPVGMIEDVVLAAFALNRIFREVDEDVLLEHWSGRPEHLNILHELAELVDGIFGGRVGTTLNQWYEEDTQLNLSSLGEKRRQRREAEVELVREENGEGDLVDRLRASGL